MLNLTITVEHIMLIILLWLSFMIYRKKINAECLVSKPTGVEKEYMASDIINNKNLFISNNMSEVRQILPWMDAITYEDVRKLIRHNDFNTASVVRALG